MVDSLDIYWTFRQPNQSETSNTSIRLRHFLLTALFCVLVLRNVTLHYKLYKDSKNKICCITSALKCTKHSCKTVKTKLVIISMFKSKSRRKIITNWRIFLFDKVDGCITVMRLQWMTHFLSYIYIYDKYYVCKLSHDMLYTNIFFELFQLASSRCMIRYIFICC